MNKTIADPQKSEKRFLFLINTAGQVYTWRPLIRNFLDRGYTVNILARDQGYTTKILQAYGLKYSVFKPVGSAFTRLLGVARYFQGIYDLARDLDPTLIVGFGVDASITALRLKKPCIIFTDGDGTPVQSHLVGLLSTAVVTPRCFRRNLGKKHIRLDSYKELMYLHPNYFRADPGIYDELGIKRGEKYIIVRFNAFSAVHDIGDHGFSTADKYILVRELQKFARLFISAEGSLPEDLNVYKLPIAPHRIHNALYYAQMVVCDTGTMTVESALLGTPGIICSTSAPYYSNYTELENKYGLVYVYSEPGKALSKALELIQQPDLKEQWAQKRRIMLSDKKDITGFLIDLIGNYPESYSLYQKNREASIKPAAIQLTK